MEMLAFIERNNTIMLAFNFHGMCNEAQFLDENNVYIWDALNIPCYNILADHPYYYYKLLAQRPRNYCQLSIDLGHEKFMRRFFPQVKMGPFLPLAGTQLAEDGGTHSGMSSESVGRAKDMQTGLAVSQRPIEVVFTGNYASPSRFTKYITRLGEEYEQFYYAMIDDLLQHPTQTVEQVVEKFLRREIPEVTEAELKETMQNITFLDLYVRYTIRGEVVKSLVDGGIRVHVFGDKWDELCCEHKENLINGDSLYSVECLEKISQSKISINVLPWFKGGAHDRIFNTMLNGSVCLTDSNPYLDTMLVDGENCVKYDLLELDKLPELVRSLLSHPEQMQQIADNGYRFARQHTWAKRMDMFSEWVEKQ